MATPGITAISDSYLYSFIAFCMAKVCERLFRPMNAAVTLFGRRSICFSCDSVSLSPATGSPPFQLPWIASMAGR